LRSVPTSTAWLLLVTGIISFIAGWRLGWVELFVVAAACGAAILLAIPFILGRSTLDLERIVNPTRVTVGDRALAEMRASNAGTRRSPGVIVEERIAGALTPIEIPELRSGQAAEFLYNLPTERRGVFDIGPATITRGDPLGLLRRSVGETGIEKLWVHPRTVPTKALASGFAKDLEGPTFDTSPAGDIAFHAIREYEPGDDVRHIHWMSTARKGALMVRHYVDNRRPYVTAVVDPTISGERAHQFELAIEIAASLGVSAISRETPASVRVGERLALGRAQPATATDLLDELSLASPSTNSSLEKSLADALAAEHGTSVLAIITAGRTVGDLLVLVEPFRRQAQVIVVNLHDGDYEIALPRVRVINARNLTEFGAAWERLP